LDLEQIWSYSKKALSIVMMIAAFPIGGGALLTFAFLVFAAAILPFDEELTLSQSDAQELLSGTLGAAAGTAYYYLMLRLAFMIRRQNRPSLGLILLSIVMLIFQFQILKLVPMLNG
jgi:hypothetical protein